MKKIAVHPTLEDFSSGLQPGNSLLVNKANVGRTLREVKSGKQVRRAQRIRDRSNKDRESQGKQGKK